MEYEPADYPLMDKAAEFAGCDTEKPVQLYKTKATLLADVARFSYIAFFDENGIRIGDVAVRDRPGSSLENDVVFDDEF